MRVLFDLLWEMIQFDQYFSKGLKNQLDTHFLQNLPLIGSSIDVCVLFFQSTCWWSNDVQYHSELYITGGDQHISSTELNPVIFI